MGFWGKAIGAGVGFMLGGPLGAIFGGAMGHMYDKSSELFEGGNRAIRCPHCGHAVPVDDIRNRTCPFCGQDLGTPQIASGYDRQFVFYVSMASLAAKMAKADGVVTEDEIRAFDGFVQNELRLNTQERKIVARLFNEAKESNATAREIALQFKNVIGYQPDVMQIMLQLLFRISMADGRFHPAEEKYIQDVASVFGLSSVQYDQIKALFIKKNDRAYQILGVSQSASDQEIKSAYKKLVTEYHPDKLMAKGVPEDFMKIANQKMAEINTAYDQIAQERGIR
jgi:DnaJ like chaperone protein